MNDEGGVVRDDAVADEVVRAFYLYIVDVFFGYGLERNDAVPHAVAVRGDGDFHSLF